MADITDAQAVRFVNENARPLADLMERVYRTSKQFQINLVQDFENRTQLNQGSDVVVDLAYPNDPRNPVTKTNVAELKFVVEQLVAMFETSDRLPVTHEFVVNGQPIF